MSERIYQTMEQQDAFLLEMFIRHARKWPLLSKRDERQLLEEAAHGNREAESLLIVSNLRFVVRVAFGCWNKQQGKGFSLSLMDILSEGVIGLMEAIRKTDLSFDVRLTTYAQYHILRRIGLFAHSEKRHIAVSLDTPIGDGSEDDDTTMLDMIGTDDPLFQAAEERTDVEKLLDVLNRKERRILRMRYWHDLSLEQIGQVMGVNPDRIHQIENKALFRLRWAMKNMQKQVGQGAA